MVKTDASELPRIAENKRAFFLFEDEMIVFFGSKSRRLDAQFAAHAKVDPEPVVAREVRKASVSRARRSGAVFA